MCELYITCDVCTLNPVRSRLLVGKSLKSLVISRITGFLWVHVRKIDYLGSGFSTCALINWTVLSQVLPISDLK
jgi:hypothetical protein